MNFLARESLFRWRPFGRLLQWYDTIPIQREGFGLSGMRETLRRLRNEELVLVSSGGHTNATTAGWDRSRRASARWPDELGVPLVPVAIAGGIRAWPRHRRCPVGARVTIQFGPPITAARNAAMSDEQLLAELQHRMEGV